MIKTIDYIPVGKTEFDYFIKDTTKCDNLVIGIENGIAEHKKQYGNKVRVSVEVYNENSKQYQTVISPQDCTISDKGIHTPYEIKSWFQTYFIYSFIKYETEKKLDFKKEYVEKLVKYLRGNKRIKRENLVPMELYEVLYNHDDHSFIIRPFFRITPANMYDWLEKDDITLMMSFLYNNIFSMRLGKTDDSPEGLSKKISFLGNCHKWMSAEDYKKLGSNEKLTPAIYTLFTEENGIKKFYTGKANEMQKRIIAPQVKNGSTCTVGHTITDKDYKQFDEVRFDSIAFDGFMSLCDTYYDEKQKEIIDTGNSEKSDAAFKENVLYAIEGVVNHIVDMILDKIANNVCSVNAQFDKMHKNAK